MKKVLIILPMITFSFNAYAITVEEASYILFKQKVPVSAPYLQTPWGYSGLDAHAGIDFNSNNECGGKVYSPVAGEVVYSKDDFGTVSIKDDRGIYFKFLHLQRRSVTESTRKKKITINIGDKIGEVGGIGAKGKKEFQCHLHIEVTPTSANIPYGISGKSCDKNKDKKCSVEEVKNATLNPLDYFTTTSTPSKTLSYIEPSCADKNSLMTVGDTKKCWAKAYYSDGSDGVDITSKVSWSVVGTALSVNSGGKVTALGSEKNTDSKIVINYPNITPNSIILNVEGVDGKNLTTYKGGSCFTKGNYSNRGKTSIPNGTLYLYYSKTCKSKIGVLIPKTNSSKTSVQIVRDDGSTQSYSGTGRIYTPMLYAPSKKVCVYGSVDGASLSQGVCK